MVPKFKRMPELMLEAIASALPSDSLFRPSSFAALTMAPKVPRVPDE
jgi:hypothetical protein